MTAMMLGIPAIGDPGHAEGEGLQFITGEHQGGQGVSGPQLVAETGFADILSGVAVQSLPRRLIGTGRLELEIVGEESVRWIDDVRRPVVLQRVINRRIPPHVPGRDAQPGPGLPPD